MEFWLGLNEHAPHVEAQAEPGHDADRAPDATDADVFDVAPRFPRLICDETEHLAAALDSMRQTREFQRVQGRQSPPPDMPEGLDTHRPGADRATRAAVETMLNHVAKELGLPEDPGAVAEDIRAFIRACPSDDTEAEEQKGRALRTLSTDRRDACEHVAREEHCGLADAENTYYVGAAAQFSKPAIEVCTALWRAIDTLPEEERMGARTQFVGALAQAQQRDFSGEFAHICAPGQFQLIVTYLQHYFPELIKVVPPPKFPDDYVCELYNFVVTHYGQRETLPEGAESVVHTRALQIWEDAGRAERGLQECGYLTLASVQHRAEELNVGTTALLQFYGLTWTRPATALAPGGERRKSYAADEPVVIRMPSPPRPLPDAAPDGPWEPEPKHRGAERGVGDGEVLPQDKATEILLDFQEKHVNDPEEPNEDVLNDFYAEAIAQGRELFADRPEMHQFDEYILTNLLWEYNFAPTT